jgi:hypothetical protein
MPTPLACCTAFLNTDPEHLIEQYEALADPPCGYLTRVGALWLLTDVQATETADWGRQLRLGTEITENGCASISVFCVGDRWGIAVAVDGVEGPIAVYEPDDAGLMADLPRRLLGVERTLAALSGGAVNAAEVDRLFGALLEGVLPFDEVVEGVLLMLGCHTDWLRWAWADTIPQQLFLDPDLADRVLLLGDAKGLWEE